MWLHRVPRSDNCLGNCPFASPARMFGTRREKNVSSLICNDAVTWSVRGVLQRRMDLPGVGGGVVLQVDHHCSLDSFRFQPTRLLHNISRPSPSLPLPRICTIRFCRSQSRRTAGVRHQPAVPVLVLPGRIIATWELLSAAPRSLGVCIHVDERRDNDAPPSLFRATLQLDLRIIAIRRRCKRPSQSAEAHICNSPATVGMES
jgi:hypothetical protein